MMMTPAQRAQYDRILDESLRDIDRWGGGTPAPGPSDAMAPPPAPAPAAMNVPAGLEGGARAGFVLDWIQNRARSLPGGMPDPAAASPAVRAPMMAGDGGAPAPVPAMAGDADVLANPYLSPAPRGPDGRPVYPEKRPPPLPAPAQPGVAPPPSRVAALAAGGGGESMPQRGGGRDYGVVADIFPGLFPQLAKRRQLELEAELQGRNRLAELARIDQAKQADRAAEMAAGAPERQRSAQRWQWEQEDRAKKTAAPADAMRDPASPESARRRAAFRAAYPDFAAQMDRTDPEALAALAAGDEKTWAMVEGRAEKYKKPLQGGGGPRRPVSSGAYAEGLAALENNDTAGALKAVDELYAAGDRKGAEELRKLATQGALASRRGAEVEGRAAEREQRKRDEADRRAIVMGWRRVEGAPELSAAESGKVRDGVAALESLRDIARRMDELGRSMSPADRAAAAAGKETAQTAEAMQLQRLTTTQLRILANMGVPSEAEMRVVNEQAPELRTMQGLLNAGPRYQGLVRAIEMKTNAEMKVRGYERDVPKKRMRYVSNPKTGEVEQAELTDAAAEALKAKGMVIQ